MPREVINPQSRSEWEAGHPKFPKGTDICRHCGRTRAQHAFVADVRDAGTIAICPTAQFTEEPNV